MNGDILKRKLQAVGIFGDLYQWLCDYLNDRNKTNDPILDLTPENITQHSGIEGQLHTKEAQHPLK